MLEDDVDDAHFIESSMIQDGLDFESTLVSSKKEFLRQIEHNQYDLIISDHHLPGFSSIEALRICNEKQIKIPFILVTGAVSDEYAVTMLREGASDYVLKDRLQRLPSAIKMILEKQKIQMQNYLSEQALKRSNERFELAAKASFDVIWDYDPVSNTVYCNEALEKNFGYNKSILSNPTGLFSYVHPEDLPGLLKSIAEFLKEDGKRWQKQLRIIRSDRSVAYVNSSALLLRDENNNVYRITGVLQDITEIVHLQNVLNREKIRRQREIAENIIIAQEKERSEIGKELHDNVNQLLATAKIMIDAALSNPAMKEELLRFSQDSILSAIQEVRSISHSMMPPSLNNDRFTESLKDIAQRIELSGTIQVELLLPTSDKIRLINEKIKLALYRIIQEQTSNIIKYSGASQASISLELKHEQVLLIVADDGRGFDPTKKAKGIGLKNIENRTEMLEGKMEIMSRPRQGCILKVRIPLNLREEQAATALLLFDEENS